MRMNTRHKTHLGARLLGAALCVVALAGCHQDMWNQPKYTPLQPSDFFADGAASRPIPEGTVEFMQPRTDDHFYLAKNAEGEFVTEFPASITVDAALLDRGQRQYEIFCSPCHGYTGEGNGMITKRGFKNPPSYHEDRLKAMPIGYFFDVMSNGFGTMYGYKSRIHTEDRWAIAAYVRALQLTQTPVDELSAEDQEHVAAGYNPHAVAEPEGHGAHEDHGEGHDDDAGHEESAH